jgi:hypothetical protein
MRLIQKFASALALVSLSAIAAPVKQQSRTVSKPVASAEPFAIAANPLAARAGLNVLKAAVRLDKRSWACSTWSSHRARASRAAHS